MARKKYHHLFKRGKTYYFRKDGVRFSLETTVATEAIRKRDTLLENYRLYGQFVFEDDTKKSPTFGQVAKKWAKTHNKRVEHSTWRDYRSAMNKHVLPAFKDKPIQDITYLDVENFISGLNCRPKRVNNILVPMRSVFKVAFKEGYVENNVMLKVDNLKLEQPDINPFNHDEVLRILSAVDPYYRPYTAVRFYTGMRDGEINGLRWSDYKEFMLPLPKIHINKAYVYNIEGKTKTKKSKRYIDCIELVKEAMVEQQKITGKSAYIFLTKDGGRMTPDHFRKVVWQPALNKAGLEYRPPIQTRHTFATLMLSAGEDIGWVQNMMGHSSLQMIFTRYFAWIPKATRNDGSAFMNQVLESDQLCRMKGSKKKGGKVIALFAKNDPKTTHPTTKAHSD